MLALLLSVVSCLSSVVAIFVSEIFENLFQVIMETM